MAKRSQGPLVAALMDHHLPKWRFCMAGLDRLLIRH